MNPFRWLTIFAIFFPITSFAQDTTGRGAKTVDLNDQLVQASGLRKVQHRSRVSHVSLVFRDDSAGLRRSWDSTYFLTKFMPPSTRRFKLVAVSGRVKKFDTALMDVNLVVFQIKGRDTMLLEIPIPGSAGRSRKQQVDISLRGRDVYLEPSEFYLGYSFRTKSLPKEFVYRLYATSGGEGLLLSRRKGSWSFVRSEHLPYVFPFTISFLEG